MRGFTLLETIVVVAIVAVLAGMVAPLFLGNVSERRVELATGSMDTLADAIERFYRDTGRLPPTLEALVTLNVKYDDDFDGVADEDGICEPDPDEEEPCATLADPTGIHPADYPGWNGPYIAGGVNIASNPLLTDNWGTPYGYCFVETGIDLNGNDVSDLICVGPGSTEDSTRRMQAWAVGAGVRLCPQQDVDAILVSYGRLRSANGIVRGDSDQDGWPVFADSDVYEEHDATSRAAAYDDEDYLRIAFNDVGEASCLETGVVDESLAGPGRNYYRALSLAGAKQEMETITAERLEALSTAIQTFYRDTGMLPPVLEALITLKAEVEYNDDHDEDIDEDGEDYACERPCDPRGIDARNYPNWNGPYVGGGLPLGSNMRFLDGRGTRIAYLASTDPAVDLDFEGETSPLDGLYRAVLYTRGPDGYRYSDYEVEYEDGEPLTFGVPGNDDVFQPVTLHTGVAVEKIAATNRKLQRLNEAALQYHLAVLTLVLPDPLPTPLPSGLTDPPEEPPFGFYSLDVWEQAERGGAVDHLIAQNYAGGAHRKDSWGNVIRWSQALHQFYSVGPNGVDDSTANPPAYPFGDASEGDDVFE